MDRRSLTQEYYMAAVDTKGNMPAMHRDASYAGLVVAGLMEMVAEGVITIEKKKITVNKGLPEKMGYLTSLYQYMGEKARTTDQLINAYMAYGTRMKQLTADVGESLAADGSAQKAEGGLIGQKTVYIPSKEAKDELIGRFKEAFLGGTMDAQDISLAMILKETKNLYANFTKEETKAVKERLKDMKSGPADKPWADMINYVDDMSAIMASITTISM